MIRVFKIIEQMVAWTGSSVYILKVELREVLLMNSLDLGGTGAKVDVEAGLS